jgi:hypothetical protein
MVQLIESLTKKLGLQHEKSNPTFRIIGLSYQTKDDAIAVIHDEQSPATPARFHYTKEENWLKDSVKAALQLGKRKGSSPIIEIMPASEAIEFSEHQ